MNDVIHFYRSKDLSKVRAFYVDILGFSIYKDQELCLILDAKGYGKIGFCTHHPQEQNNHTCITFVYSNVQSVKNIYEELKTKINVQSQPSNNEKFKIFHFYATDFENNTIEFQTFLV